MGRLKETRAPDVEGKTPLDDVSGLRADVQTREQLNAVEFENINRAITKYLGGRISSRRTAFTYDWFLQVHRDMFGRVWSWAGIIRGSNKSIGIDKIKIREALKTLEMDCQFWITSGMDLEEAAARLHHRLVWIHPFENGNGRWARLITNIYLKNRGLPLIEWPEAQLLIKTDIRKDYLAALHEADQHNFASLIALQKRLR